MPKDKALASLLSNMKASSRAAESASLTLQKHIDDFCRDGNFDKYITTHADNLVHYLRSQEDTRRGTWRASAAGKCAQDQAFSVIDKKTHGALLKKSVVERPPHNARALHNGTFMHARYHMMFDALDEIGTVKTIAVESLRFNKEFDVSGTIDRAVTFEFDGKWTIAILDYKSMRAKYFNELLEPKTEHVWQQHTYDLFGYDADIWVTVYENKDTHELKIYDRSYHPVLIEQIKATYVMMDDWVRHFLWGDKNTLPKLPLTTTWCNWCDWNAECLKLNPERGK